jgi:PPM family protein phosphatase
MLEIDACVLTHAGNVRTNNEDSVSLVRPTDKGSLSSHGLLALVADGMGGHEGGEFASQLALQEIVRSYYRNDAPPSAALERAMGDANREVYRASRTNPLLKGMGTTCVALVLCDDEAWWGWIGDSRLYLLRNGKIYRLSEDHTVVQDMVRRGLITAEEAHSHSDRSVLERALGTRKTVEPGLAANPIRLAAGDRLLLCSDGLHDLVEDEEMVRDAGEGTVTTAAEKLLHLALDRGGHDNVSVVLLEARLESGATKKPPITTREYVIA